MATKALQTQLEEVQTAITKCLLGQSYSVSTGDGASWTESMPSLTELYGMEKELRSRVERETRGGIRIRGVTIV